MQQRTIQQPINLEGIGLHSGNPVHLRFSPAPIDYGIQFLRSDVAQAKPIPAIYHAVTDTMMSSNLTNGIRSAHWDSRAFDECNRCASN